MRKLSESFFNDLKDVGGLLHPILQRVKQDHTLMIAIRNDYINIYYRGGSLLKIDKLNHGSYQSSFDLNYNIFEKDIPDTPQIISSLDGANKWVNAFPRLKEIMDLYFSKNSKPEREFQQLVARENNYSTISNESEYFFPDIESADSELGARFDMLAIRWLATKRKNGSTCQPAFIEMKYGDGALGGSSGLVEHLKDFNKLIKDKIRYKALLDTMEDQFNQLLDLGLLKFNQCSNGTKVKLNPDDKPEVIFLLANHNPRSPKLKNILNDTDIDKLYGQSESFDLKFYVSSFAGYGFHADNMKSLDKFRELL